MSFNLLVERWIPVLMSTGRFERVGIRRALTEAGRIRQIAASNPLDNVALLRFLLAVLLWCKKDAKSALSTLSDGSVGIVEDWLAKLDDHRTAFNLLGDGERFYQDCRTDGKEVAATNLLHELPSGSKIAHFRHCRDGREQVCLACCAVALVRWPVLASAGTAGAGQSMTASLNGNTPAYGLRHGESLLATLRHECPDEDETAVQGDCPVWDGASEDTPLGILRGLSWRTRRVKLILGNVAASCAVCGSNSDTLVQNIYFRPGWKRPTSDPWAADPQLLRVVGRSGKRIVPQWPGPNDSTWAHAAAWSKALVGILEREGDFPAGTQVEAVGAASEQALYKDIASYQFRVEKVSDEHRARLHTVIECQELTTRNTVSPRIEEWGKPPRGHYVVVALRNAKCQGSDLRSSFNAYSPHLHCALRSALLTYAASANALIWRKASEQALSECVSQVVRSTTPGSPLRRREAMLRAQSVLSEAIRKVTTMKQPSEADVPAEDSTMPRRSRRKRKSGEPKA